MEAIYVIKKPLISEKATYGMNEEKRYSFLVDRTASKDDIKAAVEQLYKVRVVGVNTQVRKGKQRRLKYGLVVEPTTKKAVVRLHPEDQIELF
ncbi:MAG: 50S ribosomal protein L23 [Phycisphaerales bacterium]|jgi:large subunit ribosomal protein L23|nr:50S ribosomal protein L23 [Phycisphaerales bacterium]